MKKLFLFCITSIVVWSGEYVNDIDRNGVFTVMPNQPDKYSFAIRGSNYVRIKASPVNCRLRIYDDQKHLVGATSLMDFGYTGKLRDGNYDLIVQPLNTQCKTFEINMQEMPFFTISNNYKDPDILNEEKRLSHDLTKDTAESTAMDAQTVEDRAVAQETSSRRQEHEAAKKALLEQMKQ